MCAAACATTTTTAAMPMATAAAAAAAAEVCDGLTLSPWQPSPRSSATTAVPAAAAHPGSSHTTAAAAAAAAMAEAVLPPPPKRRRAAPWSDATSGHGKKLTWSQVDDSDDDVVPATAATAKEPAACPATLTATPELVPGDSSRVQQRRRDADSDSDDDALDNNKGTLRLAPVVGAAAVAAAAQGGTLCPKCGGSGIECAVERLLACTPRRGAPDDDDPAHYEYFVLWAPTWELYAPTLATEAAELLRRRRAELVLRGHRSHR